ncbi:hypothetical protein MZO42_06100 [Sphingomonas psychrotolerans]|uniref:Uncharacterized protein n=1 Tax=Sphingomonas psychrotolerans TaxID=1327635 RepID=A0ABU3N133_9SPHN|nr:hypothetical protein [Sphingomonas psychrotolerans]MDT8758264.1 hypothetical protein [Sphingomonas psychrotolerans]
MIIVRVELWSAGDRSVTELARMTIDNTGGTSQLGDYRTRTLRGRSFEALNRAMLNNTVQREGKVTGHPRLREHVWNLVAKALTGLGYGTNGGNAHRCPQSGQPLGPRERFESECG